MTWLIYRWASEKFMRDIYLLSEMSIMCRHRSGRLANFVRLAKFFADFYIEKYVSQAILHVCQTYGLAQMKKLPDMP